MKKKTPNKEKIRSIINELQIKPNLISGYFLDEKMYVKKNRKIKGTNNFKSQKVTPIADRTFAEILKGNETKEDNLKALAALFSKLYKKNTDQNKIISLSDISMDDKDGLLRNNLRIIKTYNDLIIDKFSTRRIPFFKFNIDEKIEPKVNGLLKLIDKIYNFYDSNVKIHSEEDRYALSHYSQEIKIISEVNSALKFLNDRNVYLYSGQVRNIPLLEAEITSRSEQTDNNDYPEFKTYHDGVITVVKKSFNIYYFTNNNSGEFIEAIYNPRFSYKDLDTFIKKYPFKRTSEVDTSKSESYWDDLKETEFEAENFYGEAFLKKFNHFGSLPFNFDRSKIEFKSHTNIYEDNYKKGDDPILDEYLDETGLTYEEAMDRAEDQAIQMLIDRSRGK